jgi:hypothetical protein
MEADGLPQFIVHARRGRRLIPAPQPPSGNTRFYARIEKATGIRREEKPRGRPWLDDATAAIDENQGVLDL